MALWLVFRVAQKECNTYDHWFQRNSGTKSNSWVQYCVEKSFSSRMTPRSLILWRRFDSRTIFLRQCHFQNLLLFYQKSRLRTGGISLSSFSGIVTLQSYVMNASLYSYCLRFSKQEQILYPGEPNKLKFAVRQLWLLRQKWQILKNDLVSEKRP